MKPMKPEPEMCSKPKPNGRMFEVEEESRKKKPGKNSGKNSGKKPGKKPAKCPTVDEIIADMAEEMSGKIPEFEFLFTLCFCRRNLCLQGAWLG